jgi:hypothetical protein
MPQQGQKRAHGGGMGAHGLDLLLVPPPAA